MNNREALLRSILENPGDDTPRRIFADHLEECGEQERAEFVRLQCELARTIEPPITAHVGKPCVFGLADPNCPRCKFGLDLMREQELLRQSGLKWVGVDATNWQTETKGAIGRVGAAGKPRLIFTRGFVSSIRCSWADWLRHADAIYWHPKQTVECDAVCCGARSEGKCGKCLGSGRITRPFTVAVRCAKCKGGNIPVWKEFPCSACGGTGSVEQSAALTCQPLEEVTLTTAPTNIRNDDEWWIGEHRFERVKCETCDGHGAVSSGEGIPYMMPCDQCGGTPRHVWTCEAWPGIVFKMPRSGIDPARYARWQNYATHYTLSPIDAPDPVG